MCTQHFHFQGFNHLTQGRVKKSILKWYWHIERVAPRGRGITQTFLQLGEGFENKKVFWNGPGTISSWPPSPLGRNGPLILFFARPFFIISNAIKLKTTKVVFLTFISYFLHPSLNYFSHLSLSFFLAPFQISSSKKTKYIKGVEEIISKGWYLMVVPK